MALKHLIQNAVIDYVNDNSLFREVTYNSENKATVSDPPLPGFSVVTSIHVNETGSVFGIDPQAGRDQKMRRNEWTFALVVKFKTEIDVEDFEQAWMDKPLILSRQATSSKQVTLYLTQTEINHPPQKSSSTGTSALFTIQAQLSRN